MGSVVPVGLILLVGPPAAGKSSFARALVSLGRIDAGGVVSGDAIRREMVGDVVRVEDDPAVFDELDRRVLARVAAGSAVLVDATNVTIPARVRALALVRGYGPPVSAMRFTVADEELLDRNARRRGSRRVPEADLLRYAEIFRSDAGRDRLAAEGFDVVLDVPGRAEGMSPTQAAERFEVRRVSRG